MAGQEFICNCVIVIFKGSCYFSIVFQVIGQDVIIKCNVGLVVFRAYGIEVDFKECSIFLYWQAFWDVDILLYSQLFIVGLRKVKFIVEQGGQCFFIDVCKGQDIS